MSESKATEELSAQSGRHRRRFDQNPDGSLEAQLFGFVLVSHEPSIFRVESGSALIQVHYLRHRGDAGGLKAARQELLRLHDAGHRLQQAYEDLHRQFREVAADAVYWQSLAEASRVPESPAMPKSAIVPAPTPVEETSPSNAREALRRAAVEAAKALQQKSKLKEAAGQGKENVSMQFSSPSKDKGRDLETLTRPDSQDSMDGSSSLFTGSGEHEAWSIPGTHASAGAPVQASPKPLRAHRKVLFQDTVETIEIEGGTQNGRTVRRFNEVSLLSSEIASAHFVSELKQGRATQLALLTDTDAVDDLARWDTRAASDDALQREVNTLVQAAHSRGTALAALPLQAARPVALIQLLLLLLLLLQHMLSIIVGQYDQCVSARFLLDHFMDEYLLLLADFLEGGGSRLLQKEAELARRALRMSFVSLLPELPEPRHVTMHDSFEPRTL
ncbi:unnamed protein product [Effrenium voratum]|uniref:Uncharacterized protein n=1 Tax=Effrenium voratum TaxID=2562239 RepID=A0AA36I4N8_9DINO|nr:unnamed protein product [Effrenium voratum]